MATAFNTNFGIPYSSCSWYPPSDSDDEESLSSVLKTNVHIDTAALNIEPTSTRDVQASFNIINHILTQNSQYVSKMTEVEKSPSSCQSPPVSLYEIPKKVDSLITENSKLKGILLSNMDLKKHFEIISRELIERHTVQESHNDKFNETKMHITAVGKNLFPKYISTTEDEKSKEHLQIAEKNKNANEIIMEQLNNVTQVKLEAAQEKIKELENEIQELKGEMVKLRDNNNNLTVQVSVAQNDNNKLRVELKEKERNLNNNQDLLQRVELELFKTKQRLIASQRDITELKELQVRTISAKDLEIKFLETYIKQFMINAEENAGLRTQKFACPQCQFRFSSLYALQKHVHRCIELNSWL